MRLLYTGLIKGDYFISMTLFLTGNWELRFGILHLLLVYITVMGITGSDSLDHYRLLVYHTLEIGIRYLGIEFYREIPLLLMNYIIKLNQNKIEEGPYLVSIRRGDGRSHTKSCCLFGFLGRGRFLHGRILKNVAIKVLGDVHFANIMMNI